MQHSKFFTIQQALEHPPPPQRQEANIRLQNTNKYITTMLTYFLKDEMKLVYQTLELVVGTLCMAQALTTLMECN